MEAPDQAHDADLAAARERRQPDRVAHEEQRREHEEHRGADGAELHTSSPSEDRADGLALVADVGDAVEADDRALDAPYLSGSLSVIHTDWGMSAAVAAGFGPWNFSGPSSCLTFSNATALDSKR